MSAVTFLLGPRTVNSKFFASRVNIQYFNSKVKEEKGEKEEEIFKKKKTYTRSTKCQERYILSARINIAARKLEIKIISS